MAKTSLLFNKLTQHCRWSAVVPFEVISIYFIHKKKQADEWEQRSYNKNHLKWQKPANNHIGLHDTSCEKGDVI